jgi:hypothetical protein
VVLYFGQFHRDQPNRHIPPHRSFCNLTWYRNQKKSDILPCQEARTNYKKETIIDSFLLEMMVPRWLTQRFLVLVQLYYYTGCADALLSRKGLLRRRRDWDFGLLRKRNRVI